jgi:hypothetical protein
VVQRGNGQRFTREPMPVIGIVGLEDFEGDVALEPRVVGPVDLTHATGAKQGNDFV